MKIKVLFFGILKDLIGKNSLELNVDTGISISNLKEILLNNYEKLNAYSNFAIAVNEAYIDNDYILNVNDEVALIPPVSGG